MPTIDPKLNAAVTRAAKDRQITAREAKQLVNVAKATGSKTPIDDIFAAVSKTNASIAADATRYVLGNLTQKLSRKEWEAYAQKAASPSGIWGPSDSGATKVPRAKLPEPVKRIFDRWYKSDTDDKPEVSSINVAGKPVYLMSQYSEFGTSFALFDAAGKSIEIKEDSVNVKREASRIQQAYDVPFSQPALKNWKSSIQHTEIGVTIDYSAAGTYLEGAKVPAYAQKVVAEMKARLKTDASVFRNKTDGTVLVVGHTKKWDKTEYALFSKTGKPAETFTVES